MEKINPNQNTEQSTLTGTQSLVKSEVSDILNQERKHPELDIRKILTTNPIAMDYYGSNRITEEDIPFLEEAKDSLTKDYSIENFEKISMQIPKNRLDIGWILSFIYAQLNLLNTRDPIVIRSLRHYHPNFKNLSAHDVETLEQVL